MTGGARSERERDATSRFYVEQAVPYAAFASGPNLTWLRPFLARLEPYAEILEIGCGNGRDSAAMIARGFHVTPTDGTPEMAAEASKRLGMTVGVLRFEDIDVVAAFDGVWANACLLHVPRAQLGGILAKVHVALRSRGAFFASFKAGEAEGFDSLGRYYNYPSKDWLRAAYELLPWASVEIEEAIGTGYDNRATGWLHVIAVKC